MKQNKILSMGCCFVLSVFCLLFSALPGWAIGMGVDPGGINLKNVPLGKTVSVSELAGEDMILTIENKSNSAYTYTINILLASEATAALPRGYADIPDISWIWPENKEVRIPAHSKQKTDLYLNIPKKQEYDNKKYMAVIEVKSKKNKVSELFVLACQLKILFSTGAGEEKEKQQKLSGLTKQQKPEECDSCDKDD